MKGGRLHVYGYLLAANGASSRNDNADAAYAEARPVCDDPGRGAARRREIIVARHLADVFSANEALIKRELGEITPKQCLS